MKRRDILISAAIVIAAIGSIVALTQRKGYIVFSTPDARLDIRNVLFGRTITSSLQPIAVPAGTYGLGRLSVTAKQDGQTWRMMTRGSLGRIKVQPGETIEVKKWGPPFKISPQVSIHSGVVSVDYQIIGQHGERYANAITKDGATVLPPRVKIHDEHGNVLVSGQFEYG
jgi:hypothetical protein